MHLRSILFDSGPGPGPFPLLCVCLSVPRAARCRASYPLPFYLLPSGCSSVVVRSDFVFESLGVVCIGVGVALINVELNWSHEVSTVELNIYI